jgi:hypothetical protein
VLESRRSEQQESRDLVYMERITDFFDFPPAAYENLNDFVVAYSGGVADGTFSHLQEKADVLAYETFAENSLVVDSGDDCEEDCEECLIPDEWKKLPPMMESVDVMDFLGITRVKPLKASLAVSQGPRG